MDNKPVHITLGCVRFLSGILEFKVEKARNMKEFYQSRLDELNEAIKAAEKKDSDNG